MTWFRTFLRNLFAPAPAPEPAPPTPAPPDEDVPPATSAELLQLADLHNAERLKQGLSMLSLHSALMIAAKKHAAWMASRGVMSHAGQGGSSFADRVRAAGYELAVGGENVAAGYRTPASVFSGWMGSRGHRRNILGGSWRHVGLGVATGGNGTRYWCAVFAVPRSGVEAMTFESALPLFDALPEPLEGDEC